jgi:hypothetical protein
MTVSHEYTRLGTLNPLLASPIHNISYSRTRNTMAQITASTSSRMNYQSIFDDALSVYKKKTGKDLRSHPLLSKLENCDSPDAVLIALREQIPGFDQTGSNDDKYTKWLDPTVNVLFAFSSTIGAGVSLVSLRTSELL